MILSEIQKQTLNKLLDKYERSKTYKGESMVQQSFSVVPCDIMRHYNSDWTKVDEIENFNNEMEKLSSCNLVRLQKREAIIEKIFLNMERLQTCYKALNREDKNSLINRQIDFYDSYTGRSPVLDNFCHEQINLLRKGNKPKYSIEDVRKLLPLCLVILDNKQELLERELSILYFKDSKEFERHYRSKVCSILKTHGDYTELLENIDDPRETEQIILGEHNISANTSYVYIKGDAEIKLRDLPVMRIYHNLPLSIPSKSLYSLEYIKILCPRIMTIENLTSYNRMKDSSCFFLFLSGYHNTAKQYILKSIAKDNPNAEWLHFGDLDPDGFLILENLKRKTGIDFHSIYMGVEELKKYKEYGRPLQENDRKKAEVLKKRGLYTEEMEFMLDNNCKIEQEIISLSLNT